MDAQSNTLQNPNDTCDCVIGNAAAAAEAGGKNLCWQEVW